jgi:hypothetical protein
MSSACSVADGDVLLREDRHNQLIEKATIHSHKCMISLTLGNNTTLGLIIRCVIAQTIQLKFTWSQNW